MLEDYTKGYSMEVLEERIGYRFRDRALLKQAMTHSSFTNEQKIRRAQNYERLEFLGDAVLELVSSEFLFREHSQMSEGELTKKRASMVCEPSLAFCARDLELGRFMLAPYGCLVTKAIHEKHIYKEYIGVDACAVNLMRPAVYGAYHHITVAGKEDDPCDHTYDVVGSLCENCDKFAVDRQLPAIDKGDLLVIHDTGAHGFSMGYNYNGKLRSAELLLKEDGSVELIRRAETPKDYFATFDFCKVMEPYG